MRVAAGLYAAQGFHATAISAIAAACNTSKSLLYHYFPSKEDLLFEVMDSHLRTLLAAVHAVDKKPGPAAKKLLELGKVVMQHSEGAQSYHKVLLDELDSLPPPRRKEIVARQRELLAMIERYLVELRPDLRKKKGERRAAVMLYIGMLNWTMTWFDPRGEVSSNRLAEMATHIFVGGLALPER